jgi:hypothetical protein
LAFFLFSIVLNECNVVLKWSILWNEKRKAKLAMKQLQSGSGTASSSAAMSDAEGEGMDDAANEQARDAPSKRSDEKGSTEVIEIDESGEGETRLDTSGSTPNSDNEQDNSNTAATAVPSAAPASVSSEPQSKSSSTPSEPTVKPEASRETNASPPFSASTPSAPAIVALTFDDLVASIGSTPLTPDRLAEFIRLPTRASTSEHGPSPADSGGLFEGRVRFLRSSFVPNPEMLLCSRVCGDTGGGELFVEFHQTSVFAFGVRFARVPRVDVAACIGATSRCAGGNGRGGRTCVSRFGASIQKGTVAALQEEAGTVEPHFVCRHCGRAAGRHGAF